MFYRFCSSVLVTAFICFSGGGFTCFFDEEIAVNPESHAMMLSVKVGSSVAGDSSSPFLSDRF